MAFSFKEIKFKLLELVPLFLLFFISLNGNSVIDFKFFSINAHYILIYYWVLKRPQALGYGFIFLSGIITDVIIGLPITYGLLYLTNFIAKKYNINSILSGKYIKDTKFINISYIKVNRLIL